MPTTLIRNVAQSIKAYSSKSILTPGTFLPPTILTLVQAKPL